MVSTGLDPWGSRPPYPHLRQFVASRHVREVDSTISLTADPLATVRTLNEEDGLDIWLCGNGELAPEIDRLILKPVAFDSGIALFGNGPYAPRRFKLIDAKSFDSGVVIEDYVSHGRA